MTAQGALHYHAVRWVWNPAVGETVTVLSSTWTQEESVTARDADQATYEVQEGSQAQWFVTEQCDCEHTPDVWPA